MCAVHPISQPRLVDGHSNIAAGERSGVHVKVAENVSTVSSFLSFLSHAAPLCFSEGTYC